LGAHLARPRVDLASDEESHRVPDDLAERGGPRQEVVLVRPVGVALPVGVVLVQGETMADALARHPRRPVQDRKSTRLNSSHVKISYAVFCLKKKKTIESPPCNQTRSPIQPNQTRQITVPQV